MSNLLEERKKTAEFRFYILSPTDGRARGKFTHLVCDAAQKEGDKTVAKFKNLDNAKWFLEMIRLRYINTGE